MLGGRRGGGVDLHLRLPGLDVVQPEFVPDRDEQEMSLKCACGQEDDGLLDVRDRQADAPD